MDWECFLLRQNMQQEEKEVDDDPNTCDDVDQYREYPLEV